MGYIYRAISPSGKSYIGQTCKTPEKRWQEHIEDAAKSDGGKCRYLNNAIRKYGHQTFKLETLIECNDSQLDNFEVLMIKAYASFGPMGYNLTSGGGANKNFSEESKELMRESQFIANDHKFEGFPDVIIPKYMIRWNRNDKGYNYKGYAINEHPNCKFKSFTDPEISLLENFEEAKAFLEKLNSGEIKVVKRPKLPDGVQYLTDGTKTGYRAVYIDEFDIKHSKRFLSKKLTMEQKLEKAVAWLEEIRLK